MRSLRRQRTWALVVLCGAGVLLATAIQAQQRKTRSELKQAFERREQQTKDAMRAPGVQTATFPVNARVQGTLVSGARFNPVGIALQYDFELVPDGSTEGSGQFVNPAKYTFHPKERFFLRLKSATPIQVALVQAYDDGRPDRLVLPSDSYPKSYSTVTPDQGFIRFDVLMEMDDDTKPETMKILAFSPDTLKKGGQVSLNDVEGTPADNANGTNLDVGTDDTITGANGALFRGVKGAIKKTAETISTLHAQDREFQRRTRFQQGAAVRPEDPAISPDPEKVSIVAVSDSARIAVATVTIPKQARAVADPVPNPAPGNPAH
jgi:hypothetical protein